MGMPELRASPEELIMVWRSRLESMKTAALRRGPEAQRCGGCGFPQEPRVDECVVCGITEWVAQLEADLIKDE